MIEELIKSAPVAGAMIIVVGAFLTFLGRMMKDHRSEVTRMAESCHVSHKECTDKLVDVTSTMEATQADANQLLGRVGTQIEGNTHALEANREVMGEVKLLLQRQNGR